MPEDWDATVDRIDNEIRQKAQIEHLETRCAGLEALLKEAMRLLELVRLDQTAQGSTIMLPWIVEWQEQAKQAMGEE